MPLCKIKANINHISGFGDSQRRRTEEEGEQKKKKKEEEKEKKNLTAVKPLQHNCFSEGVETV